VGASRPRRLGLRLVTRARVVPEGGAPHPTVVLRGGLRPAAPSPATPRLLLPLGNVVGVLVARCRLLLSLRLLLLLHPFVLRPPVLEPHFHLKQKH
jgi:hypothetical protein